MMGAGAGKSRLYVHQHEFSLPGAIIIHGQWGVGGGGIGWDGVGGGGIGWDGVGGGGIGWDGVGGGGMGWDGVGWGEIKTQIPLFFLIIMILILREIACEEQCVLQ